MRKVMSYQLATMGLLEVLSTVSTLLVMEQKIEQAILYFVWQFTQNKMLYCSVEI
jgi:hypothetical protein